MYIIGQLVPAASANNAVFLNVSHVTGPNFDIFQTHMCCCQANHSTDIETYEGSHYIS